MDLEMSFVDFEMDFVGLRADFVDLGVDFMELGAGFEGLKMNFRDSRMNFVDLEMDFVGLGLDFVDGEHLGYFLVIVLDKLRNGYGLYVIWMVPENRHTEGRDLEWRPMSSWGGSIDSDGQIGQISSTIHLFLKHFQFSCEFSNHPPDGECIFLVTSNHI
ncbi:hypothetical protein FXO37_19715 [Capsicum annuum]|nr:hypothetical protein FXO37_19715 [Capsicum annuum]